MADQSNYTIEEHTVMKTWVHESINTGKTTHNFQTKFNKVTPPQMEMNIMRTEQMFQHLC
jgi:hypothetical protein